MSEAFYNSMAATASKLITKFGAVGEIKRTTGATIDPVTGVPTAGTTVIYSPNTIVQKYADELVDGARILSSDRMIILDNTIEPVSTDTITIRGVINDTRVDTGRMKGNWQTTVGMSTGQVLQETDKSGVRTVTVMGRNVGGAGETTYLTNNVPYVQFWEQRDGMVAKNIARLETIIRKNK